MTQAGVKYKKSAMYPGKKTISLTREQEEKWSRLSQIYKVAVVDELRPLIDQKLEELWQLHQK